jgi:hypothetical protein
MARSLIKREREEYVPSDETVEVNPLVNKDYCYAGKEKGQDKPDEDAVMKVDVKVGLIK